MLYRYSNADQLGVLDAPCVRPELGPPQRREEGAACEDAEQRVQPSGFISPPLLPPVQTRGITAGLLTGRSRASTPTAPGCSISRSKIVRRVGSASAAQAFVA